MQRRDFFKITIPTVLLTSSELFANENKEDLLDFFIKVFGLNEKEKTTVDKKVAVKKIEEIIEETKKEPKIENIIEESDTQIKIVENKEIKKEQHISKDVYLNPEYVSSFINVRRKLLQLQRFVGYGNFNIISFDEIIELSKKVPSLETFTKEDLDFMEYIFYYDPNVHGFYGKRISNSITEKINKNDVIKISGTGHYLFKGNPHDTYFKMLDDIGDNLILTSGVRSIVKQMKLFLDKVASVDTNLSVASKSLAPPAYTYHTIADFDVGKKGFGHANFSPRFALTEEFLKMRSLKYIEMRYTINNKDGVRYEPWHVKVI
ncbi:M15 family metallopeptidase [Halarcobacter sp.]|uniref:M15 family metallopeptidase n=1 Tax=Halarcobacter sp. TaxID=2321133 RepID=UPI0029F5651F|nr:M15 family metallopeptidase [Halarcobacter sp.]